MKSRHHHLYIGAYLTGACFSAVLILLRNPERFQATKSGIGNLKKSVAALYYHVDYASCPLDTAFASSLYAWVWFAFCRTLVNIQHHFRNTFALCALLGSILVSCHEISHRVEYDADECRVLYTVTFSSCTALL